MGEGPSRDGHLLPSIPSRALPMAGSGWLVPPDPPQPQGDWSLRVCSPGEGSDRQSWDTLGGGDPPSRFWEQPGIPASWLQDSGREEVCSGLMMTYLGKGEIFGLCKRHTYCRGLCPGSASRLSSRMTEPRKKDSNYPQSFSVHSGTLSNCIWDSWLLVSLVISGLFVLNFQFNLLNPSLSWLTFV